MKALYKETPIIIKAGDSIQEAINQASPGDTVYINPGTYYLTADLLINKNITLKALDPNPDNTVIKVGDWNIDILDDRFYIGYYSYKSDEMWRCFEKVNNVTLEGLTISDYTQSIRSFEVWIVDSQTGYGTQGHWATFTGSMNKAGAIHNYAQNLTVKNCKLINNTAQHYASTIYTWHWTNLTLINTTFANNSNVGNALDGAVYLDDYATINIAIE